MEKFDVAIIGAGPAGLEAAKILAKGGRKIVILEKNSIIGKKVCAGGLTTRDFLLGVSPEIADITFKEVTLKTPFCTSTIKSKQPFVATLTREKLGQFLAAQDRLQGVKIYTNKNVIEINKNSLKTEDGQEIAFDYLIGADGSASLVRRYLNIESEKILAAFHYKIPEKYKKIELIFDAKLFGSGYAWIFPHKEFTSIGAGVDTRFGIDSEALQNNFRKWAKKRSISLKGDYYEAWMINYDYRGHQFDNFFLIGDAGGFASGMTGEGIYFAMVSGSEIAKKILDPSYNTPELTKLLSVKAEHEKVLSLLQKNNHMSQFIYTIGGIMFKTHFFDKKLVKKFS